jgi:hypothetical protein
MVAIAQSPSYNTAQHLSLCGIRVVASGNGDGNGGNSNSNGGNVKGHIAKVEKCDVRS